MSLNDASSLPAAPTDRPQEYVAEETFDDLGLSPELRKGIADRGYTSPTPVQAKAFRPVMAGKDVIVRSKTGTGKTAAFGIPLLEKVGKGARGVKALIMCPTRELALQVATELTALSTHMDVEVVAIYGGASMKQQEDALERGAAIVVGTPGRVYDHIRRKTLKLDGAQFAVLDEADEMLNQGFYEEVTRILDCLPKSRQVLLFSATVPEDIQRLIAKYTTEAETLLLSGDVYTVDHINHVRYDVSDAYPKPRNLIYLLEMEEPDNAIIFCNTRDDTELVTAVLNRNGFDAELLNGDLPQKERERVMGRVKRGEVAFMVATDLAARGIDISDLGHVINYSLPEDPAVYLHRVGRTGRIGKKGTALNLVSGRELTSFSTLEKKFGITFEKRALPNPEQAVKMWTDRHVKELKDAAQGAIYEGFLGLASELKKRPDADELIAFMLRSFFQHRRQDKVKANEGEGQTSSPPPPRRSPERERDERPRRGGREERGERGERGRRPERESRERRPSRDESRGPRDGSQVTSEAPTQRVTAVERTDAPAGEASTAPAPATPVTSPSVPKAAPARRMTDRELFEALQSGQPLPPMADPTSATPSGDAPSGGGGGERRERRDRDDGRERRPRRERTKSEVRQAEAGQVRLWVNLGSADGLDAGGVSQALEAAGAPSGQVQHVELLRSFSYVFVGESNASGFESTSGKPHGTRTLKVERARK